MWRVSNLHFCTYYTSHFLTNGGSKSNNKLETQGRGGEGEGKLLICSELLVCLFYRVSSYLWVSIPLGTLMEYLRTSFTHSRFQSRFVIKYSPNLCLISVPYTQNAKMKFIFTSIYQAQLEKAGFSHHCKIFIFFFRIKAGRLLKVWPSTTSQKQSWRQQQLN